MLLRGEYEWDLKLRLSNKLISCHLDPEYEFQEDQTLGTAIED